MKSIFQKKMTIRRQCSDQVKFVTEDSNESLLISDYSSLTFWLIFASFYILTSTITKHGS